MLSGVNQNPWVKVGVDFIKEPIGDTDNQCFFENIFGKDKVLPGGPTFTFKGKIVPCFVRWSEKGGIASVILTEILREMDSRETFDRIEGRFPFALLDGHSSRTHFEFLNT